MPVVVIGGGLTAIDTATESLAYYAVQVEKFLERYEKLVAEQGRAAKCARTGLRKSGATADEFLAHARAIRAERAAAAREGREPDLIELINSWGGVTIAYRRRLIDSPSYTLNHEEVAKALEEGVRFAECLTPARSGSGRSTGGHARWSSRLAVRCRDGQDAAHGRDVRLPARSILVAAGTQPNTVLAREDPAERLPGRQVVSGCGRRRAAGEAGACGQAQRRAVLMSVRQDGAASASSAICILLSRATWSRPWAAPSKAIRWFRASWSAARPAAPTPEAIGGQAELRAARRGEGRDPADAEHRRSGGAGAAWPRARSSLASSTGCRIRNAGAAAVKVRGWRWKDSR